MAQRLWDVMRASMRRCSGKEIWHILAPVKAKCGTGICASSGNTGLRKIAQATLSSQTLRINRMMDKNGGKKKSHPNCAHLCCSTMHSVRVCNVLQRHAALQCNMLLHCALMWNSLELYSYMHDTRSIVMKIDSVKRNAVHYPVEFLSVTLVMHRPLLLATTYIVIFTSTYIVPEYLCESKKMRKYCNTCK